MRERIFKSDKPIILVLAPHTDDGELGCGGTLARFIEEGAEIYYAAFSIAAESVPKGFKKDILRTEVIEATHELGIPAQNLLIFDYRVRELNYTRQEILEELVKLRRELSPNLVFVPSRNDIHQDHATVAEEAIRAFKEINIFGYELPWNNLVFNAQCFVCLEENHLEKKVNSLQKYRSQVVKAYMSGDYIRALAKTRGVQIGSEFAECFEVIRLRI
jgi:N-acetylglucosamine malate deacetylase 1